MLSEYDKKKEFIEKFKSMIDKENFSVGYSTSPNFDRKVTATIGSPNFEKTVVTRGTRESPWPHDNTSTGAHKLKYN